MAGTLKMYDFKKKNLVKNPAAEKQLQDKDCPSRKIEI